MEGVVGVEKSFVSTKEIEEKLYRKEPGVSWPIKGQKSQRTAQRA
jgi:hypothetical protein